MIADIRNPGTVWRPAGVAFIDILVGGQLVQFFRGYVIEIERVPLVIAQIALDILLEVVAIDDDRLGRGWRLAFFGVGLVFGLHG